MFLDAAPIPVAPLPTEQAWVLPGGEMGLTLESGGSATGRVTMPDLSDKEKEVGGQWRGILSVDAFGTSDGKQGDLMLEALDPQSGEVFGSATTTVSGMAPRAPWAVIASSEQGGSEAERLFDGDPATDWHSRYGEDQPAPPHWAGLEFGKAMKLEGVRYTPRQGGFTNGVARNYRLEIRKPGGNWEVVAQGESGEEVAKERKPIEVRFSAATAVDAFRFVIESDWSGGGFGTGGEIEPLGIKLPPRNQA